MCRLGNWNRWHLPALGLFTQALLQPLELPLDAAVFGIAAFPLDTGRFGGLASEDFGVGKGFSRLTILAFGHEGFAVLQNLPGGSVSCRGQFVGAKGARFGQGRARGFKFPVGGRGAAVAEEDEEQR